MKAVILAGGRGTRLAPLTKTIPKPLAVLGDKPILFHILDSAQNQGIDEVIITLGYLGGEIEKELKNYKTDMKIFLIYEDKTLGTAGAVKNAVKDIKEDFFVLSGDAYSEFDLKSIFDYHKKNSAVATVVTTKVKDPREYGLVIADENGRIKRFIEKPGWSQAITDTANTGIYVLSEKSLEYIPDGQEFDFSKNLFPIMLKNNNLLFSYNESGYWCDIGDINSYLECNSYLLSKIKKTDTVPRGNFIISNHVLTGKNVKIDNNSEIGKNSIIGENVTIGKNTRIAGSVVYPGCKIGDNCIIENSVICPDATVEDMARIYPNCCIGSNAKIGRGCSLFSNVRVNSNLEVCDYSAVSRSIDKSVKTDYISSVSSGFVPDVDCFFSLEMGCAVGSALNGAKLAVATDGTPKAKSMMYSFISGAGQTGAQCWLFGEAFYSQMYFFTYFCSLPLGVYFYGDGDNVNVKMCAAGGLPVTRDTERKITAFLNRKDYLFYNSSKIRHPVEMHSVGTIYSSVLFRQSESSLSKIRVKIKTDNKRILYILEDCIKRLEGESGDGIILNLSNDGTNLSVTESNIDYSFEDIIAVLFYYEAKNGSDVTAPFFSPQVYSSVVSVHNRRIYRYYSSASDSADFEARNMARGQLWTRDALFTAIRLLSLMHEENKSFAQLKRDIPDFYLSKGEAGIDYPPTKLFEIFSEPDNLNFENEGITIKKNGAKAIVLPDSDGKKIKILSESFNTETAKELCSELIDKISSFGTDSST